MTIHVFSRTPGSLPVRAPRRGKAAPTLEVRQYSDLPDALPSMGEGSIVYLDLGGLGAGARGRLRALIARNPRILFGIIDGSGAVADPASLFHAGAVDYIGKAHTGAVLDAKRLAAVLEFARGARGQFRRAGGETAQEPSPETLPNGWASVVGGREHPFAILLVEVDGVDELKKRFEAGNLALAMETFRAHVEKIVGAHGGRTWMWSRFGGLALFPLAGEGTAPAVCGLRLLLARLFYDVEESLLPGFLSFRMALSVGRTVYHETNTGGIVADSLNSIFHLGRRFARPGQFLLTADALELAPPSVRGYCVPAGSFEGRKIFRMTQLLSPKPQKENEWPEEA